MLFVCSTYMLHTYATYMLFLPGCGEMLHKSKGNTAVIYSCASYTQQLHSTFMLDTSRDQIDIHPSQFCNRCYSVTKRREKAAERGTPFSGSISVERT